MSEGRDDDARLHAVASAAAVALVLLAVWREHALLARFDRFVHDDALITLRYARNVLEGNGAVWNPGERVEGYTSPAALAGIVLLGACGVELLTAARVLDLVGIALLAAAVGYAAWRHASPPLRPLAAAVPVALAISSAPLLLWVQGGLEAPLVTGWVAVALALVVASMERTERWLSVVAGLALGAVPLVRPDAGVFLIAGAVAWVATRRDRDVPIFVACALGPPAVHVAARLAYYGALVPNTVLVKATGLPPTDRISPGWSYLWDFVAEAPWIPAVAAAIGVALLVRPDTRKAAALLLVGGLAQAAAIAAVGGDHMIAHRLLLPVLAPALLLVGLGVAAATRIPRSTAMVGAAALAAVGAMALQDPRYPSEPADPAAYVGAIVGRWLADNYPPGTLVALNTAGSTPYVARDLRFLDMLGLNDRHIAQRVIPAYRAKIQQRPGHGKGDGAYVIARDPDLVIIGPAEGRDVDDPWFLGDLELKEDPRFLALYRKRTVEIPVHSLPDHKQYRATRDGTLAFTWYERVR